MEAARQLGIVRRYGIPLVTQMPEGDFDVVIDAIFGIGLDREVGGVYRDLILQMNRMPAWKMAVDISSGISADDGAVLGCAFRADLTVTFGFAKVGQLLYPGAEYTGELKVKDIGIDGHSLFEIRPELCCLEPGDLAGLLPRRTDHSNKGSYGKLLIVAGSRNMAGAAAFSARAAYRTGSGLVKVVTEECNREIIQTLAPEAVLAVLYGRDRNGGFHPGAACLGRRGGGRSRAGPLGGGGENRAHDFVGGRGSLSFGCGTR